MEKKSWVCTVIIQLALCFALYYAINLGEPQTPTYRLRIHRQFSEIYFISVRGGFRTPKEQTRLLKQIEKVMNTYKVGFVINISELGEDDPLLQNATQYFNPLKAPWYTTVALQDMKSDYFFKQVNVSSERTLDIIALNNGMIQDPSEVELKFLSRKLESSNSNWHIATGFHPLFCNQSRNQTQAKGNNVMLQMLMNHGVDAYLSGHSCDNEARIEGPYLTTISQESLPFNVTKNMFLLHRVSPLEIVTYGVSFKGDIVHESTFRQRGREVM
ncbi:uncharacterized protein LOC111902219 [Lactuca sativa]|uniref:Calcineurin-like phosphoesterase domain-containing protein n=1 Tax=Lactuca sativa TaxID=4236 RepID=A0A9R1UPL4_LACSA|nr:uncharacterized protein LOC111902219 [Lactuca sativa]KAJ0191557.1 hypothetical protein LSAT_V11C800414410 [Lactuca sativa]